MPITDGTWHVRDGRLTHPQSGTKGGGDGLSIMTNHAGPNSSFTVATVNPWGGGNLADAHVLAASKDMLAVLKAIHANQPAGVTAMLDALMGEAAAAIAKAEGRADG